MSNDFENAVDAEIAALQSALATERERREKVETQNERLTRQLRYEEIQPKTDWNQVQAATAVDREMALREQHDTARNLVERLTDAMHTVEHGAFCRGCAGQDCDSHYERGIEEWELGCDVAKFLKGESDA